jgi:hypothetical protein
MTRYEVRIEELVLHGVPAHLVEGLGPLVQERLAERPAAGAGATAPVRTREDLADRIADAVLQQLGRPA